ncbi:MAG: GNAT family N-acetyltransferase [Trueperaceae bacterium]
MNRLAVHPDFACRGIGGALLSHVLHSPTVERFIVNTAAKNTPAIQLYEKHGFTISQRQTLADGLELVRLEKHQN